MQSPSTSPGKRSPGSLLRMLVGDEQGVALVLVLVIVVVLSISTVSLQQLVTSNEHAFGRDRQEERAFNVAEAGLNNAVAYLSPVDSASKAIGTTITSAGTYSLGGGTYDWSAVKTVDGASSDTWVLTANGTEGTVTRKVSVQVTAAKTNTTIPASGAWAYGIFVGNPSGCTNVGGGVALTLSVFVLGDLCLSGSATDSILEPSLVGAQKVDLYVAGKLFIGNNPTVGTAARRIRSATVVNGCFLKGVAKLCNQGGGNASHVWASTYSNVPLSISKPPADAAAAYASGDWSTPSCSTGSFTFDNNTTRNTSVGTFSLMTGSSYNCTVYKAGLPHVAANVLGTLSWTTGTKTLAISGVIYVDGNMQFNGGDNGKYTGFGSLWINGTVTTNGNSALCGPPSTLGASLGTCSVSPVWDGNVGAMSITAVNASNLATGWTMNGTAEIDAAVYVNGAFSEGGNAFVTGPVITDSASLTGSPTHTDVNNPPPGTPGSTTTSVTSAWGHVVKGTWRQCPNSGCS